MLSMCREYDACLPAQKRPVRVIRRYDWWAQADYTEATFSELLEDPVIRQMMTSDGVDPGELRALFADLNARLAQNEVLPGEVGRI
jgi:hypothetical protein